MFDVVHDCEKRSVKNSSSVLTCVIEPFHIFLTGNSGCGKSFLTKVLYQSQAKTFSYWNPDLDKPEVLLLAPSGLASVNIDGTTTHTGLGTPIGNFGSKLPSFSEKMKSKLSQVKVLMIDEIWTVSNDLLLHSSCQLVEIFGCRNDIPFSGITIVAVEDFLYLLPVRTRPVYAEYKNDWLKFAHAEIIDLLNHICVAELNNCNLRILKSKFIFINSVNYPTDALNIFAENALAAGYNTTMQQPNINHMHSIEATDILPKILDHQKLLLIATKVKRKG